MTDRRHLDITYYLVLHKIVLGNYSHYLYSIVLLLLIRL
jgi:hypothetical protein